MEYFLRESLLKILLLYCLFFLDIANSSTEDNNFEYSERGYPLSIPVVHIRRDSSGRPVERGRLELIGGVSEFMNSNKGNWLNHGDWKLWSNKNAISLKKFRDVLQCASFEPDLDGKRGILSFMRLVKISRRTVELACAWAEHRCWPWVKCKRVAEGYKNGTRKFHYLIGDNPHIRLMRVMKGKLYLDWPWGSYRIYKVHSICITIDCDL